MYVEWSTVVDVATMYAYFSLSRKHLFSTCCIAKEKVLHDESVYTASTTYPAKIASSSLVMLELNAVTEDPIGVAVRDWF